jgi:hypothetical protein
LRLSRRAETVLGLIVAAALAAAFVAVRGRRAAAVVPDVSRQDALLELGDATLRLSAGPRPLVAFAKNRYRVRAERRGAPVPLGDAVLSFTMEMPMGDHRHPLAAAADGWQEAEAVLPSCVSGNRRWLATLSFTLDGRPQAARFAFDLEPPSAAGRDDAATSR